MKKVITTMTRTARPGRTTMTRAALVLLVMLLTTATAWAQTSASYRAYNTGTHAFETLTANSCTAVTSDTSDPTTMNSGWYVVNSNVTFSSRITINGTVNLILADGYSLTASQGITVNSGNTLNIYGQTSGTGALNATGTKLGGSGTEAAGIGSTGTSNVGDITIHGGHITATGADWSAGIGGSVNHGGGSITIYGGTTSATAGDPSYGGQDAIGSGADGTNVTRFLADGLRVTTYNNTTPVEYGNRVSNLNEKVVRVEPCTSHNLNNNVCTYCGVGSYTVTYNNYNATSGTAPAAQYYRSGETVTVLGNTGNLARTGYTFSGWNNAGNGLGTDYAVGSTFTITSSLFLFPKWTPITYTVRFHKNDDGEDIYTDQAFTYDNAQTLTANAFTRDGYDFMGWSTTTNGAVEYTDGQSVSNLANVQGTVVNLYAQWAIPYTITYDLAGGTVATPNPTTYYELSDDITLTNPTRDGYVFAGWTGTGLTEPTMTVTIPKGSTGNRSYTATWGNAGVYLAYNTATGEFETRMAPDNITYVTSGTTTMGAADTETWYVVNSDATISNRITVNGTVHLILCDGATLTASKGITVNSGNTLNIYGQSAGTGALNARGTGSDGTESAAIGSTGNTGIGSITIHGGRITANGASWSAGIGGGINGGGGSVTIYGGTVNATGHDGSSEAIGHGSSGTTVTKTLINGLRVTTNINTTPVAYGDRVSSLSQKVVTVEPCTEHHPTTDHCEYCGIACYGVAYDSNNATGGTIPASFTYYQTGETVTVLENTGNLERTGYTFAGWNTAANGSGTDYTPGTTFSFTSSVMLYAKWTPIEYNITYDLAGGSVASANPTSYTVESAAITLVNPTRSGYIFAGWTGTSLAEQTMTVTIAHGSTGNRSYTATWLPNDVYYNAYNTATGTFEEHLALSPTLVANSTTTMGAADTETWYTVSRNATVSSRIEVVGTVNLILCDGKTLTASQGLHVQPNATLNIYCQTGGTGALTASTNNWHKAAIGSDGNSETGGIITIHGGVVRASSSYMAAAIGGGIGGSVIIRGGTVTATGDDSNSYSAGIGSGYYGKVNSITITGGIITASGTGNAIGVGAGGDYGTLNLGNMKVYASAEATTPVATADRESTCHSTYAKLMPCTEHNMENGVCTYCGFTICHVSYDGNNATSGTVPTDANDYESCQTVTVLGNTGNLVRTGYTFGGWNTKADGSGTTYAEGETFTITSTLTLYAKWTQNIYTITYDLAGGSVATPNPTTYTDLSEAITLVNPTREGYGFIGWTGTDLTEPTMRVTIPTGSTGNRSYTANWKEGVDYYAYNTTINMFETRVVPDNITSVISSTTTMGANNTETWYLVDDNVTVNGRITVNGTVHLILCDGKTLTANGGIAVTEGKSLYIYSQRERTGCLTATATDGAGIGGGGVGNITIHGGNITATGGAWSAGIGGGTNGGGGSITIYGGNVEGTGCNGNATGIGHGSSGGAVAIQADGLRLQYYDYGWKDVTYSQRASVLEYPHVKFFPCTEHSYSDGRCTHCGKYEWYAMTYNGNGNTGGSVPTDNTHYPLDGTGTVTVLGNTGNLSRTGYTFGGWNTQADGSGTNYAPDATFTVTSFVTLYAKWTPITYTVRFNKNRNYASGTMDDQSFTYAVAQPLTANGFTALAGISFVGWSITPNGNVVYTDGQSVNNLATEQDAVVNLYAQYAITLANNADNDDAISAANGERHDVTLSGRTLYHDGDWNILCLPFDVDDFTDTPLEGATVKTLTSSDFNDGTLTMTFSDNLTSIEAGKPYIVKWTEEAMSELGADLVIRSAADWNTFVTNVNNGTESYAGKTVKLANDISVSKMVGIESNPFRGTFDGCGHTLNVTLSGSDGFVAPFSHVNGCTIKNLIVTGTVNGGIHCTGLIGKGGETTNSNLIENCDVRVAVTCSSSHCGGFIGHSHMGTFTIRNCKFSGSISGATTYTGVFMGWAGSPATHVNCLAAGTYNVNGTLVISREDSKPNTYDNCYTTQTIGSDFNYTTATGSALQALLGSGWEVSGGNVVPKTKPTVIVISSENDWNTFATNVNNGTESYAGKTVKLAADISVTTMVGTVSGSTQGRAFCGTFDGCEHTLTVSISDTDNQGTAPFRYISNATIKNLKTTGRVTGNLHCAGLVGFAANNTTNNIQNCEVAVSVVCSGGGHSHCGGILGHGLTSTTTIRDCLFSGTISGTTTATGIIYGWGDVSGTHTIVNCLANGTYTDCNDIDLLKKAGGTEVITNCYKTQAIGSLGTHTTATGSDLQALLGNGWEVRNGNVVPKMKSPVSDFENPVFTNVTISNTTANVPTKYVDFVGTYNSLTFAAGTAHKDVLFLGSGSTLYYPDGTKATTINACRAYFQLNGISAGDPNDPNGIKAFKLNFGEVIDQIDEMKNERMKNEKSDDAWYDLQGRKMKNERMKNEKLPRGIYIHNGKKVIIK